jgi:octaprenyl-diphosphate synthase
MCGNDRDHAVRLAATLELVHAASLIHDDVIDDADERRRRDSVRKRYGNPIAVLGGDWVYTQAIRLALETRDFGVLDILCAAVQSMIEGELLQDSLLGSPEVDAETVVDIARRKTARLFAACARFGAAGMSTPDVEDPLERFGLALGMAYQIMDDLDDLTASSVAAGKPVGADLRSGKVTLPVLLALERAGADQRDRIVTVLRERSHDRVSLQEVAGILRATGAIERTHQIARGHSRDAVEQLDAFPPSPFRAGLARLAEAVVTRASLGGSPRQEEASVR